MDVMIALGSACLLIRVGQGLYATGLVRSKNAAGAMLREMGGDVTTSAMDWRTQVPALLRQSMRSNSLLELRGNESHQ